MATRRIIRIDEEKCNGCGKCIPGCKEGALQIVNSKARLVDDRYCDGLGACVGECPQGAIEVIEREAPDFDERAVQSRQMRRDTHDETEAPHVCPGAAALDFGAAENARVPERAHSSALRQWPVQLHLVPVNAPYLEGADLLLAADCVPVALGSFHEELLAGRRILLACPKLDDTSGYVEKLAAILKENNIHSLTVAHMEVPCCYGLVALAERALALSGKRTPFEIVEITLRGALVSAQEQMTAKRS